MCKCRFCCCTRTASVIIIATYSLIQSAAYLVASFLALQVYKCDFQMDGDPISYIMYLTYFKHQKCGNIVWSKLGFPTNITIQPNFISDSAEPAMRTNTLAYYYLILSAAWMVSSVLLFIGSCSSCARNKCCHFICFQPWIFSCIGNIILDIVASYFYYTDTTNTNGILKFLNWLEITNVQAIRDEIEKYDFNQNFTSIPSIVMGLITSRLILFFIFNVWFLLIITSVWYEINGEINKKQKSQRPLDNRVLEQTNFAYEPEIVTSDPKSADPNHVTFARSVSSYHNPEFDHELDEAVERRFQNYQVNTPTTYIPPIDYPTDKPKEIDHERGHHVQNLRLSLEQSIENMPPPNQKIYNVPDVEKELKSFSPSPDPIQARRDGQPVSRNSSFSTTGPPELRSQLPWSYFKSQDNPSQLSKNMLLHTKVSEEEPTVPEPDYNTSLRDEYISPTLKHRQNNQSSIRSTSTGGSEIGVWDGPDLLL